MNHSQKPLQSSLMRQVWEVIEQTHSGVLLQSNDQDLVRQLVTQLQCQRQLDGQEMQNVCHYLSDRMPLIRDLVMARPGYTL